MPENGAAVKRKEGIKTDLEYNIFSQAKEFQNKAATIKRKAVLL